MKLEQIDPDVDGYLAGWKISGWKTVDELINQWAEASADKRWFLLSYRGS